MTVKALIKILKTMPQDLPVILQSDPEGNAYHQCDGAGVDLVDDPTAYRPEIMFTEDDEIEGNCVILSP